MTWTVMQLMAEEQGLAVSLDGFNECMEQQRERSRVTHLVFSPSVSTASCTAAQVSCPNAALPVALLCST